MSSTGNSYGTSTSTQNAYATRVLQLAALMQVARDGIRRALEIDDEEVAAITEFNPIA